MDKPSPFPWQTRKCLTSLREKTYWCYHGQSTWFKPITYTETWARLFTQDGFKIMTDDLALVKASDEDSELNPTE